MRVSYKTPALLHGHGYTHEDAYIRAFGKTAWIEQ